jgi:hypothetical protein
LLLFSLHAAAASQSPELAALTARVAEVKSTLNQLDVERNDLFDVLREVEIICQNDSDPANAPLRDAILAILYKTDGEEEPHAEAEADGGVLAEADAEVAPMGYDADGNAIYTSDAGADMGAVDEPEFKQGYADADVDEHAYAAASHGEYGYEAEEPVEEEMEAGVSGLQLGDGGEEVEDEAGAEDEL